MNQPSQYNSFTDLLFSSQAWSYGNRMLRQLHDEKIEQEAEEVIRQKTYTYEEVQAEAIKIVDPANWHLRMGPLDMQSKVKILFVSQTFQNELLSQHQPHPELSSIFNGEVLELFTKMVQAMKLSSGEFAVSAIETGQKQEDYLPVLLKEIAFLQPQYVVTLGAYSTKILGKTHERLSKLHGQYLAIPELHAALENIKMVPIFHPEFLLINPSMKRTAWEDLKSLMKNVGIVL